MKKAKDIIESPLLGRIVAGLAIIMTVIAIIVTATVGARNETNTGDAECRTAVAVKSGDTLSTLLLAQGLTHNDVHDIAAVLKRDADITTLRADSDIIEFLRPTTDARVSCVTIIPSPWRRVELTCGADGAWTTNVVEIARDTRAVYKSGEILDGDSFYLAGIRAGIPAGVLVSVYDLLAFEMDFERDVRAGQKFSVLYQENWSNGKKIDNGEILAVEFEALRGNVKMYRFKKSDGKIGYYDENGNGAIKSLKRTPINNARVTSSFSRSRKHPVLGFTRAHKGVDFRAATGTPIPSAGAGRVVVRKYSKSYGNYVKIRHNGSYETLYAHMSRFAKGVNVGTTVRQGQIIGYAGSTGYSTGPHLHYEIIKDGKHVNPLTVKLPAINNLTKSDKENFIKYRKILDDGIKTLSHTPCGFIQM